MPSLRSDLVVVSHILELKIILEKIFGSFSFNKPYFVKDVRFLRGVGEYEDLPVRKAKEMRLFIVEFNSIELGSVCLN